MWFGTARTFRQHHEDRPGRVAKKPEKNKTLYDRRAKRKEFQEGDKLLMLLPTDTNNLLMQWKGPFEIMRRCGKDMIIW